MVVSDVNSSGDRTRASADDARDRTVRHCVQGEAPTDPSVNWLAERDWIQSTAASRASLPYVCDRNRG